MMKNTIKYLLITSFIILISCGGNNDEVEVEVEAGTKADWRCGTYNGNSLWTGERGGCYYINSNGNKTYVDRSECNC